MYVKLNAIVKILYLCNGNNVRLHFKCICSIEIYIWGTEILFKMSNRAQNLPNEEAFYLFGLRAEATAGPWTRNLSAESDKVSLTPNKRSEGLSQH